MHVISHHSQRTDFRKLINFLTEIFLSGWTRSSYQSSRCFNEKLNVSTTAHTEDAEYSPPHSLISDTSRDEIVWKRCELSCERRKNIRQFNICRITISMFEPFSRVTSNEARSGRKPTDAMDANFSRNFTWKWTESTAFLFFDLPATVEVVQTGANHGRRRCRPSITLTSANFHHRPTQPGHWFEISNRSCLSRKILLSHYFRFGSKPLGRPWTYHCTHSQYSRSQKSQAINYHKSESRCINFVCFLEKFSFPKIFCFLLREGDENSGFDARRRERLAKSKCQELKMKLIRIFIFSPRVDLHCNRSSREWIMRLLEFLSRPANTIRRRFLCSNRRFQLTFIKL